MFNKIFLGFVVLFFMAGNLSGQIQYPETKKVEQTDNYYGVNVADPYRWMEDLNDDNHKLWIDKQNEPDRKRTRLNSSHGQVNPFAPFP